MLAILATLVELAQGDAVRASIDALWWVSGGECQFERTIEVGHRLPMHDARCPARCAWDRDRSNRLMDPIPLLTSRTCVRRVDSNKQRLGASGAAQAQALHGHGRATTAGNELYLLASNFLLYTALVGLSLRFDGMLGPTACSHIIGTHTCTHTAGDRGHHDLQALPRGGAQRLAAVRPFDAHQSHALRTHTTRAH